MDAGPIALEGHYTPFALVCSRVTLSDSLMGVRPTTWAESGGWLPSLHYRLLWIVSGSMQIGDARSRRDVGRDEVLFLAAGLTLPIRIVRPVSAYHLVFDVVPAPRTPLRGLHYSAAEILQPPPRAVWGGEPPLLPTPRRMAAARDLIRRAHRRVGLSLAAQLRVNAWLAAWLADLLEETGAPPAHGDALARRLDEAAEAQRWSVAELAREHGLGCERFRRLVRARLGVSPRAWLRRRRIEAAARALEQGDEPVAAIAARYGFATGAAFARAFRAVLGCTPGEWRRASPPLP